jgi:ubiquinone/menaquinone biosynthesis C-methylase UbiE
MERDEAVPRTDVSMTSPKKIALGLAAAGSVAGLNLWWRYAARRKQLPCPARFACVLDPPYRKWLPPSVDRLDLRPGLRVLDVGSGPGRLSIPAAKAVGPGGEVFALDSQSGMLRRLEARIAASGPANIRTMLGDITTKPLPPDWFDRALLVTVLGEIPDREAALRSIFATLKPGGILSVTEILGDPHYQFRKTVRRLAETAGFHLWREYKGPLAFTMNFEKPAA